MTHLLILQAKKVKETEGAYKGFYRTEFYLNSKLQAIIPAAHKQPKRGKKTQTLNCCEYLLEWVD